MMKIFHNAEPLAHSSIPVIEMTEWRSWILSNCLSHKSRVISLFAVPEEKEVRVFAVLSFDSRGELQIASTKLAFDSLQYPSLTAELPQISGMERELYEQHHIEPVGHPWLKPLRKSEHYPFYRIEGDEVHEGAVGPVHAGIIEPGHFRFQCHGERILHLEIQLGYQHRGVEALMVKAKPTRRALLAESIAGDTVIGHSLAYAHAMEALSATILSPRAEVLRAIVLEIERLSNNVGDLGALAGDIGFLPAAAWFGRLRGDFLNLLMEISGNRYGRSFVRPGGVCFDLEQSKLAEIKTKLLFAAKELKEIATLFFSTASVRARLDKTGIINESTAESLGLVGPVARASNLIRDVRHDYPTGAYRYQFLLPSRMTTGDVYARAKLRELESRRSLEFISELIDSVPTDEKFKPCNSLMPSQWVVSMTEGWRGEIVHIIKTDEEGKINFYKIIDPSFRNWMGLAMCMREGQISDFPLCNKSFNLSYCGHDL